MRFLADESCDFSVVRALRAAGHDVLAISEILPRADDEDVINRSITETRILLTEDKDFGQLAFASSEMHAGVILIRFPATSRSGLAKSSANLVQDKGEKLNGHFVVMQPGRVRIT